MKNATHILSTLRHKPQFKKLGNFQCIQRIQMLFPPHLQRLIRYGYIHNKILYYVLSHPGAKQEFDIIIGSIKTPLKQHPPQECSTITWSDIRAFVSHKRPPKPFRKIPSVYQYKERSAARFTNETSHKKLHSIIEQIRQNIHVTEH